MKAVRIGSLLGIFLALTTFAFGQDNMSDLFDNADSASAPAAAPSPAAGKAAAADTGFTLELNGKQDIGFRGPADPDNTSYDGSVKGLRATTELGLTATSGQIKLVSDWFVDSNVSKGSVVPAVRLGENAVYWNPAHFKFGAGWQYYTWGTADKQNPTDNLNPRDYTQGIDAPKIAALSFSTSWYPTDWVSVQGVFIPQEQNDLFPTDFKAQTQAGLNAFAVGTGTPAGTAILQNPSNDAANFVAGARAAFTLGGVDFSLSYLYDLDRFYTPEVTLYSGALIKYPTSVTLERLRMHRFGADFKTTVDKVGLWLEACYSQTQDYALNSYAVRNPSLSYTLGADLSFGPNDRYYLNVQYIGEWIPGYDASFYADYPNGQPTNPTSQAYMQEYFERALSQKLGSQTEGLTQGLTANLKFPLADDLVTPTLTVAYVVPLLYDSTNVTRFGSLIANPEIDFKPFDSFHIRLGADLRYSWIQPKGQNVQLDRSGDRIGVYTPDNNWYLKVEYSFNLQEKK